MNENGKYKYWLYYNIDDDIPKREWVLYAYTDDKNIANKFREQRNLKLVYEKVVLLSSDDVSDLAEHYNYNILQIQKGKTKSNGHGSKIVNFSIVVTKEEKMNIDNICMNVLMSSLWKYTWMNPRMFKQKIEQSLEIVNYTNGYRMITSTIHTNPRDSYIYDDLSADFLSVFIHFYGKLLI